MDALANRGSKGKSRVACDPLVSESKRMASQRCGTMTAVHVYYRGTTLFQVVRTIGACEPESISCESWEKLRVVLALLGVTGLRLDYILEELEISEHVEVRI